MANVIGLAVLFTKVMSGIEQFVVFDRTLRPLVAAAVSIFNVPCEAADVARMLIVPL